MTPRRPISAPVSRATLPTLAALVAGSSLTGCQSPVCSDSRSGELATHGGMTTRDLSHGELSGAAREIGIALGVVSHPMRSAGAAVPITSLPPPPPVVVPPPIPVVSNPSERHIRPAGGPMRVQAHELAMQHPQPPSHRRTR